MNPSITIYVQFHKRLGYILVQLNIYVNRAFYFGYFIHFYCSHGRTMLISNLKIVQRDPFLSYFHIFVFRFRLLIYSRQILRK